MSIDIEAIKLRRDEILEQYAILNAGGEPDQSALLQFRVYSAIDITKLIEEVERLQFENAFLREWLRGECTIVDVEIDAAMEDERKTRKTT